MQFAVIAIIVILALGFGGSNLSTNTADETENSRVLVEGGEVGNSLDVPDTQTNPTESKPLTISTAPGIVSENTTSESRVDFRVPRIITLGAQNIKDTSATVRSSVNTYAYKGERVYVVYGYDEQRVKAVSTNYKSFDVIPTFFDDRVRVQSIDSYVSATEEYATSLYSLAQNARYFYTYCLEYDYGHVCGEIKTFSTLESNYRSDYFYQPTIYLQQVQNIEAYSAELSGTYSMKDADFGTVFVVYGQDSILVNAVSTKRSYASISEDDEDLQKVRVLSNAKGNGTFSYSLKNLDRNKQYFYRACIEVDDDDFDGVVCSSVSNFTTDRRDTSEKPLVKTEGTTAQGTLVTLTGAVDMNDFNDGHAFFVYGTSQSRVDGVNQSSRFTNIYQSGDTLQLISLDTNVDINKTFTKTVTDLKPTTVYYYKLCVEYEDTDQYGYAKLFLACSDTRLFATGI